MREQMKDDLIYYAESAGVRTTRICGNWIEPNKPPVAFSEKEYRANEITFSGYAERGVIIIHPPDSPGNARAAQKIRAEKKRQEIEAAQAFVPPASRAISVSGNPIASAQANLAGRPVLFSQPDASLSATPSSQAAPIMASADDNIKCIAVTRSGSRCKNDALMGEDSILVCSTHLNMLLDGKEVFDAKGLMINTEGTATSTG